MLRVKLLGILAALLLIGAPILALADAAGKTEGVDPAATAALAGTPTRTLTVGADLFIGDVVETGALGLVQIRFADNTELVVGPDSKLTIEDFLIRNDGSAGLFAVNMLAGAFRFATGDAAKNRYKITTPTGTIGVRGTGFDTIIDKITGYTWILLYNGKVRFCTLAGDCQELGDVCEVGQIQPDNSLVLGDSRNFEGEEHRELRAKFIYAVNQSGLLREYWMKTAPDCVNKPTNVSVAANAGTAGNGGKASSSSSEPPPSSSSSVPPSSSSSSAPPPSSSSSVPPSSSSSSAPSSEDDDDDDDDCDRDDCCDDEYYCGEGG